MRYPRALEQIVMCQFGEVDERWCYQCSNCAWYGLYSIAFGYVDPRFDYDRLFRDAAYVRKIVDYAATGVELSRFGNAPPPRSLGLTLHSVFFHTIAMVDPHLVAGQLGPQAFGNLLIVKALFGNRAFPSTAIMPTRAIELLGHPVARRIAEVIGRHVPAAGDLPGPWANPDVVDDVGVRMPTRTGVLPHIRD